jgi:hypothetical protein
MELRIDLSYHWVSKKNSDRGPFPVRQACNRRTFPQLYRILQYRRYLGSNPLLCQLPLLRQCPPIITIWNIGEWTNSFRTALGWRPTMQSPTVKKFPGTSVEGSTPPIKIHSIVGDPDHHSDISQRHTDRHTYTGGAIRMHLKGFLGPLIHWKSQAQKSAIERSEASQGGRGTIAIPALWLLLRPG